MQGKCTTVLFDADMTLLDFNRSMSDSLKELFQYANIEYSKEKDDLYEKINDSFWKRLEKGEVTRLEVKHGRFREFFKQINYHGITAEEAHSFYENALSNHGYLLEGAKTVLENLYNDYDLYMITNGTKMVQNKRIDSTDIRKYFKKIFISEETGYEKPSIEYFNVVLDNVTEKNRDNMLIIGDSLSSDIKGGKNTGIKTVWFNPLGKTNNTDIIPDFEVRDYENMERIIRQYA